MGEPTMIDRIAAAICAKRCEPSEPCPGGCPLPHSCRSLAEAVLPVVKAPDTMAAFDARKMQEQIEAARKTLMYLCRVHGMPEGNDMCLTWLDEQLRARAAAIASARAQALEEAAGVAEDYDGPGLEPTLERQGGDASLACTDIAAAIRALSPTPDTTKQVIEAAKAVDDVLAERRRQIEAEGWTPQHDDGHTDGQMAQAAGVYALFAASDKHHREAQHIASNPAFGCPYGWPWDKAWFKPSDRRRDLVKAAALLLAEIERLDRAALAAHEARHG